jgi:hypothetical protein
MSHDRESMIGCATRYLDALVDHDGDAVPLAETCTRTEQGRNTGTSGRAIRAGLSSEIMHGITGYRDVRWFVDGDDAVAFYVLEAYGRTIDIAERFTVRDGEIREIEAIFDLSGRPDG